MNGEVFAQLEQKIQNAVDSIEMLKMENEELKAENARFRSERDEWEKRLSGLLNTLQSLDTEESGSSQPATPSAPTGNPHENAY
ncbi:cell division protein ZapB [Salinicola aestuarinus]|uniref:cell division protein ZapB n=1 Tax=Salinicola aestuarinus TaxID=1949082 RepID=UPI000DA250CD|nr:cell division protein ZapB [Salinicola aestuarinus]